MGGWWRGGGLLPVGPGGWAREASGAERAHRGVGVGRWVGFGGGGGVRLGGE